MKQQFLEDKTGTISLTVYAANRASVPSAATITLYTSGGSELQSETAASVNSTTGEMTYSLTTTHTATRDLNYKAIWKYTVDSVDYYETQLFDVVRSILSIPITDDDLYYELDSLRKANNQATGTATSSTASSLVDTLRRKESNDYWKGGIVEIISGTGSGQKRDITQFTQSSSSMSVTPNWTTNPDTTSIYLVVKSFNDKIRQAFEEVEQMLYNKGKRHQLILESSQIKHPLLYLALEKICRDLSDDVDDKWDRLAIAYSEKFDNHFTNMKLDYDEDDSGTITGDEEQQSLGSFRIFRA